MSCAKWLQVIGLSLAVCGTVALSIDVIGKGKVYNFLTHWISLFKIHRKLICIGAGLAIAFTAILPPFIDLWKTPIVSSVIPLMAKYSHISTAISTVLALFIAQFAIGGRASYRHIAARIITVVTVCFRFIRNNYEWQLTVKFIKRHLIAVSHLLINPQRLMNESLSLLKRIFSMDVLTYLYTIVLIGAVAYLVTSHPIWWVLSATINLTTIVTAAFVLIGYTLGWAIISLFQFFVSKDVDSTYKRLSVVGFMFLGIGFILQIIGIVL